MKKEKKPKKNQLQILVIICTAGAIVYGYLFYVAMQWHNPSRMWMNGIISIIWFFCAVVWFLLLRKINRKEKEN